MPKQPNILFLMADQMQGRILEPGHACPTLNLSRLAARGVRFQRAYTPNPVCSPARASLMTGLLPHKHGIQAVNGDVDDDKCLLRKEHPHWAQRLVQGGYRTGYFGKWHVELTETAGDFGWQVDGGYRGKRMKGVMDAARQRLSTAKYSLVRYNQTPGYRDLVHYGVTDVPADERQMGIITQDALNFLRQVRQGDQPWCCAVSFPEPHDPYVTSQAAFDRFNVDELELPPNLHDQLQGRPGVYRKLARVWQSMTDRQHREARACYLASITEIDTQFGRLLDELDKSGQADNTIVVMTADHGDLLGAHGMYCKGYTAAEEIYNIPLIVAGPGITRNTVTTARVGLHDLCPTLLELANCPSFNVPDSRSFAPLLKDPAGEAGNFTTGFAQYFGSRIPMLQRIVWKDSFKYVLNGFDFDELYDLQADPFELTNLIDHPAHQAVAHEMLVFLWERARAVGDPLQKAHYPMWRIANFGPMARS